MSPIAVAREPHHLPGLAVDRQRTGAGETAPGVEADDACFERRRRRPPPEQFLGRSAGIIGLVERRQRLRIERALVLRERGVRREKPERERDRKGAPPEQAQWRLRFSHHVVGTPIPPPPTELTPRRSRGAPRIQR